MVRYLKRGNGRGRDQSRRRAVRSTVESILAEVESRRDAAVRELSEKFDKWSPPAFKLTPQESRARHRPGRQTRPRRHQVRPGAGAQLRAEAEGDLARSGGRDAAGGDPRPQAHPGQLDRLLRAGRALSHGRLRAHVDRHRAGGRREAHHRLRTAAPGRAASSHRRRHALRRRGRDLRAGRRAGGRRHGARHRDDRGRRHGGRAGQRLRGRGQAPAVRPRRHRPAGGPHRDAGHRRRQRGCGAVRHGPARPGRARPHLAGHPAHDVREARPRDHGRGRAAVDDPPHRRRRRQGLGRHGRGDRVRRRRRDGRAKPTASRRSTCR